MRCGGEPWGRRCASGDDVCADTETRDTVIGAGEEERGAMLGGYILELALLNLCRVVSDVPWVGVGGGSTRNW